MVGGFQQTSPPIAPQGMPWRDIGLAALGIIIVLGGLYFAWTLYASPAAPEPVALPDTHTGRLSSGQVLPPLPKVEAPPPSPEAPIAGNNTQQQGKPPQAPAAPYLPKPGMMAAKRDMSAFQGSSGGQAQQPLGQPGKPQIEEDQRLAFLANARSKGMEPVLGMTPKGTFLKRSTIIHARMLNGVNSDMPGDAAAVVTGNVLDSGTLTCPLVPAGTVLYGVVNAANVQYGQTRNQIAWTSLTFPFGTPLDIAGLPATDATGSAGVRGYVDRHPWGMAGAIGASAFFSILGQASQLVNGGEQDNGNVAIVGMSGATSAAGNIGNSFVSKELNRPNTLGLNPGDPVAVMLRDNVRAALL